MANAFSVDVKQNPYGSIQRTGYLPNGRVLYHVIDSEGNPAGKLTIPKDEVDTFETSYKEILATAPKIQAYVKANSSEASIKKRRNMARAIIAASGVIGAAIPIAILRKSTSMTKKILGAVAGIVVGLSTGFVASLGVTTPPGSLDFAKATRNLSKLDIQPVLDEQV